MKSINLFKCQKQTATLSPSLQRLPPLPSLKAPDNPIEAALILLHSSTEIIISSCITKPSQKMKLQAQVMETEHVSKKPIYSSDATCSFLIVIRTDNY